MTIGFILRIWYHGSPASLGAYIAQTMFLLLSPCAFLAIDCKCFSPSTPTCVHELTPRADMLLGRLAAAMGEEAEHCLLLPPRRIAKLFVWSDVVTFFMQAAGGGMTAASGSEMAKIGPKVACAQRTPHAGPVSELSALRTQIALAGLALQLVSFSLFTVTLFLYGLRVRRKALYADLTTPFSWSEYRFWQREPVQDWRPLFCVLAVTCVGIIVRSTFRIVEYAGGYYGELATHEGYAPMPSPDLSDRLTSREPLPIQVLLSPRCPAAVARDDAVLLLLAFAVHRRRAGDLRREPRRRTRTAESPDAVLCLAG